MPKVFVAGNWARQLDELHEILRRYDYSAFVPDGRTGLREPSQLAEYIGALDVCELLVTKADQLFEIGFMYGQHKPIVVFHDEPGLHSDEALVWGSATFMVQKMEHLEEVLREFRAVVRELDVPGALYAEIVGRLRAKYKP